MGNIDLFDDLDALSPTMQELIKDLGEAIYGKFKPDYDAWLKKFQDKGCTFDFDMDGHAYNLRLLTEEEKDFEAFKETLKSETSKDSLCLTTTANVIIEHLAKKSSEYYSYTNEVSFIDKFLLLAYVPYTKTGNMTLYLYCHINDLNKIFQDQYETLKETKSNFAVKKLDKDYHHLVVDLPNFDKTGSITGMKKMYYGKQALLVRCGDYIYNVSSEPAIYFKLAN